MIKRRVIFISTVLILTFLLFSKFHKVYDGYDPGRYVLVNDFINEDFIELVWVRESLFSTNQVKSYGEYKVEISRYGSAEFSLDQVLVEEFYVFSIFGFKVELFFSGPVLMKYSDEYIYLREAIVDDRGMHASERRGWDTRNLEP